jgi:ribosomal protein L39E
MAILENYLADEVLKVLSKEYETFTEVPLYNRVIDAVLLKDNRLVTVEFKIRDWRRALGQIKTHLLAADYAYLCMPKIKVSEAMMPLLSRMGVGLWLFDVEKKTLAEILKPEPSYLQQLVLKEKILKYLARRDG